jgi:hypothetical protein
MITASQLIEVFGEPETKPKHYSFILQTCKLEVRWDDLADYINEIIESNSSQSPKETI